MTMYKWSFNIAGLGFQIEGPANLLSRLENAWSPWHSIAETQPWTLNITLDPNTAQPTVRLFEAKPECVGGLCSLQVPGLYAQIDAPSKHGELLAHPEVALADVGYFIRVAMALHAFTQSSMLFHAACVVHKEKGYLLFGLSGSGKTTAARLSAPDPVLNDDLLLLKPSEDRWIVYSTPFGKRRGELLSTPLHATLRLIQDKDVFLAPLSKGRALTELLANTPIVSVDKVWLPEVMNRWTQFIEQVPVKALHFRKDATFWEVIDAEWE